MTALGEASLSSLESVSTNRPRQENQTDKIDAAELKRWLIMVEETIWLELRRLRNKSLSARELISVANEKLLQAMQKEDWATYDDKQKIVYIQQRTQGVVTDALREQDPLSRGGRSSAKALEEAVAVIRRGRHDSYYEPSQEELAQQLGVSVQEVARMRQSSSKVRPFQNMISLNTESDQAAEMQAESPEAVVLRKERGRFLEQAIAALPERERIIIQMHMSGSNLEEIGAKVGVTQGRISQLLPSIIKKLRENLEPISEHL